MEEDKKGHQLRLRRRGLNGTYTYSYTLRYPDLHGQRVELKRLINRREYFDLLLQRDVTTQTVIKKRYSFLYKNQYYELDQFVTPHRGLHLLEFYAEKNEASSAQDKDDLQALLPDFLEYEREVTGEREYSMYNLASRRHPSTLREDARPLVLGVDAQTQYVRSRSMSLTKESSEVATATATAAQAALAGGADGCSILGNNEDIQGGKCINENSGLSAVFASAARHASAPGQHTHSHYNIYLNTHARARKHTHTEIVDMKLG